MTTRPADHRADWLRARTQTLVRYWTDYLLRHSEHYRAAFGSLPDPGTEPAAHISEFPLTVKQDIVDAESSLLLKARGPGCPPEWRDSDVAEAPPPARLSGSLRTCFATAEEAFRHEWLPIHFQRSGGTTGRSVTTAYTQYDILGPFRDSAEYLYRITGVRPTDRAMNLCPAAPHLGIYATLVLPLLIGQPNFNTFGGRIMSTAEQLRIADSYRPNVIIGITSYVSHWLRSLAGAVAAGELAPLDSLNRIVCVGEPVGHGLRRRLQEYATASGADSVTILQGMSSTEMRAAGFYECAPGSGMHVDHERFYVELLDPATRRPVSEGEPGVLVWSHIGWRGHSLARYWTGDYLSEGMVTGQCPHCGRYGQRLLGRMSRHERDFLKVRGARVEVTALTEALNSVPGVQNFQVVVSKEVSGDPSSRDVMEILVGCARDAVNPQHVADAVRRTTELRPDAVRCVPPEQVEGRIFARKLKAESVVDVRDTDVTPSKAP